MEEGNVSQASVILFTEGVCLWRDRCLPLEGGGYALRGQTPSKIRLTGGRYLSYWNAYLFLVHFDELTSCSVCEAVKLVKMSSRIARSPSLTESGTITPTAEPGSFVQFLASKEILKVRLYVT